MAAETVVTISAGTQTDVEIFTTKLDHNVEKPFIDIQIPRQKADMDSETEAVTYLIDIGRIKEFITIQGMLVDDDTTSALTKKINLRKIAVFEREITVTWGTGSRKQTVKGNIQKVMFTETAGIVGEGQPSGYEQEKNFGVQLGLMVGEEK